MADNRNKTGRERYFRPDLKAHENGSDGDVYMAQENETSDGMSRGPLPAEKYKVGSVKTKSWNHTRPMRRGNLVQERHSRPNEDTLSCNPKGTSVSA